MNNFCTPTTYEEARRMGVYWDWYSILLTSIGDRTRYIAIDLLKKGNSIENVYKATGQSEEESKLKNKGYWEKICAVIDDKEKFDMPECFRKIINERIAEIAKKLKSIGIKLDQISEVTKLSIEEIEKIR